MNFIKTVPDSSRAVFLILGVQKSGWQPSDVGQGLSAIVFWFFTESWGSKQGLRRSPKKLHAQGVASAEAKSLRNAANPYRKSIKSV